MHGIGVSTGVVVGPVARMAAPPRTTPDAGTPTGAPSDEEAAARAALESVAAELEQRATSAPHDAAAVLLAQAMMARDPALLSQIAEQTQAGTAAATAVDAAIGNFREQLASAGPHIAQRVADLDDLRNRALGCLLGAPMPDIPQPGHPFVLVADDLAPADTATLDPSSVLAIVTARGGPTSHTAILAKSLGIPAVLACPDAAGLTDGERLLVNGGDGLIQVHPPDDVVRRALTAERQRRDEEAATSGPGRTADGHPVQLLVNVARETELDTATAADSEGVGLLRTEFLFLDRAEAPDIEEQQQAYATVFAAFAGRKVVVRTLDAGADKPLAFVTTPPADNPALGVRGLRTARQHPELLRTQLQAIAAATENSDADVWVMGPMVSTPQEARWFTDLAHRQGIAVAGVMVEVPAAAIRATQVAQHCDFLSIGTNDLSQYTYAADRMGTELADLLNPWQPATLELVGISAHAGHRLGRAVGVCGEAASDPLLALVLVGLGVTSLSMAPPAVPAVRSVLARHTLAQCRELAELALKAPDGRAAMAAVREAAHAPQSASSITLGGPTPSSLLP